MAERFVHQVATYCGERSFLDIAVPFCEDGIRRGDPVLAITTQANLELLGEALGDRAGLLDYGESAYLGRRTHERTAAYLRYWRRRRRDTPRGRVRVLSEPMWAGRSERERIAWHRMEAGLNVLLAGTDIWMLCPYDTRASSREVLDNALRTHPHTIGGGHEPAANERFTGTERFIERCDAAVPLAVPPKGTPAAILTSLSALREYTTERAAELGLYGERAGLLTVAANEMAVFLAMGDSDPLTVRIWDRFGGVTCELRRRGEREVDPLSGYCPPGPRPSPGDGVWLARQLCDSLEIRSRDGLCVVQLNVPGARAEEARRGAGFALAVEMGMVVE